MTSKKLKVFLILKYGSLDDMYQQWIYGQIKNLTSEEKSILATHFSVNNEQLDIFKNLYDQGKYGHLHERQRTKTN